MSFQAMTWAVKQPVDPREKLILIILANYADPKGVCWPSMATLAKDTGYCRRTILRSIHAMQKDGLLSFQNTKNGRLKSSNRYKLAMSEPEF